MKMENQFWELEYDTERNRNGLSYTEFVRNKELHYDFSKKKWVLRNEWTGSWLPATFPCRSYRAALRHLRKHDEIPKGSVFRLVSKFVGQDRYLVKR